MLAKPGGRRHPVGQSLELLTGTTPEERNYR